MEPNVNKSLPVLKILSGTKKIIFKCSTKLFVIKDILSKLM